MKTPEVWSPTFSIYFQPKTMRLQKKTRVAGAWGLEPQTKPRFCSYLQGAGGQGSGEGMLSAVSFKTHHGLAMLRRIWPVLAGWRIWDYLYDRSFHPVVWITRCRVLGGLRLDGVAMCQKTEAVRLLDKDCLPRRRWWSHKVLGDWKGPWEDFFSCATIRASGPLDYTRRTILSWWVLHQVLKPGFNNSESQKIANNC